MDDLSFYTSNVPMVMVMPSFIVMCIVLLLACMLGGRRWGYRNIVVGCLLLEYVFLVLCSTVFLRASDGVARLELVPFWKFEGIFHHDRWMDLWEILLNIAFFIPVGLLAAVLFCRHGRWWVPVALGCLLSVCIELTQLLARCGYCEVDDVMNNTLGAALGAGLVWLIDRWSADRVNKRDISSGK